MRSMRRVLLLDDSATIRAILKVYLMNLRAEFIEAEDGATALDLLHAQPIDLVIADVKMAPMDGIAFLEQVRNDPEAPIRSMPVILLTGDREDALRARGLAAGADAFVHKPISSALLARAIESVSSRPTLQAASDRPGIEE